MKELTNLPKITQRKTSRPNPRTRHRRSLPNHNPLNRHRHTYPTTQEKSSGKSGYADEWSNGKRKSSIWKRGTVG